jgi:hypothetical protein
MSGSGSGDGGTGSSGMNPVIKAALITGGLGFVGVIVAGVIQAGGSNGSSDSPGPKPSNSATSSSGGAGGGAETPPDDKEEDQPDPQPETIGDPTLIANPDSIPLSKVITLKGAGFDPGERVRTSGGWNAGLMIFRDTTAKADGSFEIEVLLPESFGYVGESVELRAIGLSSDIEANTYIRVTRG